MQFVDLASQQKRIKENIDTRIANVLSHGKYILGPENKEVEERLAAYVGSKYALACSSGTDALVLALMAYGIGPGDAILTTPFTFIATAEAASLLGATPIFVDIDLKTFNIDPVKLEETIAAFKGKNNSVALPVNHASLTLKGVIPVDLFGLCADYDAIREITEREKLFLLEDAAQSMGGEYKGRKACSLGDIGCTSFFPAKPLGCYGDGGMCFTDDKAKADLMFSASIHGTGKSQYDNVIIGMNGRFDTIQAAVLLAKFDIFEDEVELRQKVAQKYTELLAGIKGLNTPYIPEGYKSAWAQYSILADNNEQRTKIRAALQEKGIPSAVYYPKPLNMQTAFESLGYKLGDFPVSEDCSDRIFSLPMHPYLTEAEQGLIVDIISRNS
ncbi:MAG: DegT/DnrJ/EryC1/StrS family aminotransferase [Nitrospinota bacterium]|nr:DegT/DnrJ/EryC1/StrS family aminotransferase [Nitrospinota bacterium]